MRHPSSFAGHASRRSAIMVVLVMLVGFALLSRGVAMAGTVTTAFEDFAPGSVNGQAGWRSGLDQAVVPSGGVATFGNQSLRRSNLIASSAFDNQTYSPPVSPPAGENQPNTVYIAKFSFFAPAYQPGLDVTVSPDSGDGSRMAWVDLLDTQDGVHITASDSSGAGGNFVNYDLGTLSHGQPHTIEFRIKLVPGEANDLVRIVIDGEDAGQCFTTWETYYRVAPEQSMPPNFSEPPNINSLQSAPPSARSLSPTAATCSTTSLSRPAPAPIHPGAT